MKSKILGLLAVVLLAGPMAASAVTYRIDARLFNGGTLTGSFNLLGNDCSAPIQDINILAASQGIFWLDPGVTFTYNSSCTYDEGIITQVFRTAEGEAWPVLRLDYQTPLSPNHVSLLSGGFVYSPVFGLELLGGTVTAVPEPGSLALLGLGLAGLGLSRRRKAA